MLLVNVVRWVRSQKEKWRGGSCSDHAVIARLAAFTPNSAGPLKVQSELALLCAEQVFPFLGLLLKVLRRSPLPVSPIDTLCTDNISRDAARELEFLFNKHGSDKGWDHKYHYLYGSLLGPRRHHALRILEIGLGTNNPNLISTMGKNGIPGASLRAFRDFLPNAKIFGADIDKPILFKEDRIETYYVDQTNTASFDDLLFSLGMEGFDLVIDDGLHAPNANIATLAFALRILKPNGWFVVEDIKTESLPVWETVSALFPVDIYSGLVKARRAYLFVIQKPAKGFPRNAAGDSASFGVRNDDR
jgi:SAM-dependent methyltransferase